MKLVGPIVVPSIALEKVAETPVAVLTPAAPSRGSVEVTVGAVVPSGGVVSTGPLRLTVTNYGVLRHKLEIVPTQSWGETLRVRHGLAVGEWAARPVVVPPGQTRTTDLDLAPGSYVLLDNIRGHYALGAGVSIRVT